MAKPKNEPVETKEYFAWRYEEQTQIKHKVLSAYYKIYASKLGNQGNTLFFDCHGGCGAYINATTNEVTYGSSLLIYDVAQPIFTSRRFTHNDIIVCEQEKANYDNLQLVLSDRLGTNHHIITYNTDYKNALQESRNKTAYTNNSTLFFIDPFGYYNTPMKNFASLMKSFGNELLINFMFDFLNRGLSVSTIDEQQLSEFFGCEEWKKARTLSGVNRESFLVGLYKQKLKEVTGAKFVFAYRLCYPKKDQTYYYLIHATNHIDGITQMKSCFAAINNGRVEYLGKRNNISSFFDMDSFKQAEISDLLKKQFNGMQISFNDIWESIVEDTAIIEKELRATLKTMETEKEIKVERVTSKTARGLGGKDIISFQGGAK